MGYGANIGPMTWPHPKLSSEIPSLSGNGTTGAGNMCAQCEPNSAHTVIAAWIHSLKNFTLITQNVDGLHESAGTRSVLRFHGSIWDLECWQQCG